MGLLATLIQQSLWIFSWMINIGRQWLASFLGLGFLTVWFQPQTLLPHGNPLLRLQSPHEATWQNSNFSIVSFPLWFSWAVSSSILYALSSLIPGKKAKTFFLPSIFSTFQISTSSHTKAFRLSGFLPFEMICGSKGCDSSFLCFPSPPGKSISYVSHIY